MGFLDGLLNPTKNQNAAFGVAIADRERANAQTNPFFQTQLQGGTKATGRLQDLLGLNGASSQQSALNNFTQGPAAQANLKAGLRALDQSAAARGMSLSGDNLQSLQGYGQNIYNNSYQQHLRNLSGLTQGGFGAASGITGNANALGQLRIGQGASMDAG